MNGNFHGESSKPSRSREIDIDPPKFKKARFLWEVKGNYHLKEGSSKAISNGNTSHDEINSKEECSKVNSNKNSIGSNSCRVFKDNLEKLQDHCCIQSFLQKSEAIIHGKNEDKSSDFSSFHEEDDETNDIHFLKWHTKQMIRYDIENKINAALEACLGDIPNKYVDLDISDIVEDVESNMEVKDEGILMAIESHGLKTNDYFLKEPELDIFHINTICGLPQGSTNNLNQSEVSLSGSSELICDDNSLQSDLPNNYEMNCKFWNTALSAAIYEKGLNIQ